MFAGPKIMFWSTLFHYRKQIGMFRKVICQGKDKAIKAWLMTHLQLDFSQYQDAKYMPQNTSQKVWVFWWDGQKAMPDIVKLCVNSIRLHSKQEQFALIDKDNFQKYAQVPDTVLNKYKQGLISIQSFSDVLRVALLKKHGGTWLDATLFVSASVYAEHTHALYTIRHGQETDFVSNGRWTSYCLGGPPEHTLYRFLFDAILQYHSKFNHLVDYFLFDYLIALAYDNIPQVNQDMQNLPILHEQVKTLQTKLCVQYSARDYQTLCENTHFHKLNWRSDTASFAQNSYFSHLQKLTR